MTCKGEREYRLTELVYQRNEGVKIMKKTLIERAFFYNKKCNFDEHFVKNTWKKHKTSGTGALV